MRYFLNISDLSKIQIEKIFEISLSKKINSAFLHNKNIGTIYEKPSTRTRLSFEVAINSIGGNIINLDLDKLNISRNESFEDTFEMFDLFLDGIIFRTNDHNKLEKAKAHFNKPIINALSNKSHPCQALSDLLTIFKRFKNLDVQIVWFGDINNVCFSLMECAIIFKEIKLHVVSTLDLINSHKLKFNKENIFFYDKIPNELLGEVDVVMTDVFESMNDVEGKLINNFKKFQVNEKIMSLTNENCIFMHCLPAKIDSEVTRGVLYGNKSIIKTQAYNRMICQRALIQCLDF